MTYNVQRCRGGDGRCNPDRIAEVIADGAPDIVALQEVENSLPDRHLDYLARRLGMKAYTPPEGGGGAFLSYRPLRGMQFFDLGEGGMCLRADVEVRGKCLHLFNVALVRQGAARRRQISSLLGEDLLGHRSLTCPTLVLGDFADLIWGPGNISLNMALRKAKRPLWTATYPAHFPLCGRDRAYLRGSLRIVDSSINHSSAARLASGHLPLVMTVQVTDQRTFLRSKKLNRMEIAPG